jgi:hypothetical protein
MGVIPENLGFKNDRMMQRVCNFCWHVLCDDYHQPYDSKELIMTVESENENEKNFREKDHVSDLLEKRDKSDELVVIRRVN